MKLKMKSNKELFIEKSVIKHGDKYDYSLVEYVNSKIKVKIICPEHGMFEQNPNNHISGSNCFECSYEIRSNLTKSNDYLIKFNKKHSNKYDYSLVEYKNNKTPVKIICPIHGVFEQRPDAHIISGCLECGGNKKMTNNDFIKKSIKKHGDKYDYSLVKYTNSNTKIKIICPNHGIFEQIPKSHINGSGCFECKANFAYSSDRIIDEFNKIHNNKYDYSLVEYTNSHIKIKIVCQKHGVFEQKPFKHLQSQGCPKCKLSKGILKICKILDSRNIKYNMEKSIEGCVSINNTKLRFDIYIIEEDVYIEYDGEQHFRPVESWGGECGFRGVKERDSIKDKFCKQNDIKLFRISYKDDIEEKLKEIINLF